MNTKATSYAELSADSETTRHGGRRWMWIAAGVIVVGVAAVVIASTFGSSAPEANRWADAPLYAVQQGPLTISVDTAGTIRSSQAVVIKSEVEGSNAILSLVEEGARVKKGDTLVELDASSLKDRKVDQEISVQNTDAALVQAKEDLEIAKQQGEADISAAEVALKLAQLDLTKYEQGEYLDDVREAQKNVTIAEASLKLADEKVNWSKRLYKDNYITLEELEGDEFSQKQSELSLESAKSALDLLQKFTYQRQLTQLKSDVDQKTFLLTKAKHKANSTIVGAEATLRAKDAQANREHEKLDKIVDQIAKCHIVAPVDGMVVYADSSDRWHSNSDPLAVGTTVRERQELMRLPTTANMMADVKIHESVYNKVQEDQPVIITTDALPGRTFHGHVHRIASQPDSQSMWLNPDLKVFNTEITIDGDTSALRPGMSCQAKIVVQQLDNAMYVPIQSVLNVNSKSTVYLATPEGPKARTVKVGLDNNRMVHIISGVNPGDRVMLAPPLPPSAVPLHIAHKPKVADQAGGPSAKPGPGGEHKLHRKPMPQDAAKRPGDSPAAAPEKPAVGSEKPAVAQPAAS